MSSIPLPDDVRACPPESFAVTAWVKLVRSRFAAYMAARYNGPVYLVGSSLRLSSPRDIDIRVVIADDEFAGRYGHERWDGYDQFGPNQAWIDDMAKRNGDLAATHKLNADFQVYAASHCIQYHKQPRVVLASPSRLDHLAESTAWWYQDRPSPYAPTIPRAFEGKDGG